MKVELLAPESPIATSRANISGSADMYGACSIEQFSSAGPLSLTHEDAQGWLDYVTQFTPGNFWYTDGNVKVWLYEELYDNWQDTYGADAVVAFFHSGHGAMDSNGVFQCPMGGAWDGRDWAFSSNNMALGNEQLKYLFWSTCQSLRISGGHSPIRTWHPVNKGLRMIFGFETNSIDNPNYGKFFWEEWRSGKTLAQSWLDASWRIHHGQSPSVCACGADANDALNRLNTERLFSAGGGWNNWYQWRWYNARSAAARTTTALPSNIKAVEFETMKQQEVGLKMADMFGISKKQEAGMDQFGNLVFKNGSSSLHVGANGRFDANLRAINFENRKQLDTAKAQKVAEKLLKDREIAKGIDLKMTNIRYGYTAGGTAAGSGKIEDTTVTDTTFEFRQVIEGTPTIGADAGLVRVTVDNDGNVTTIHSSVRPIAKLNAKPKITAPAPPDPASGNPAARSGDNLEANLENALNAITNRAGTNIRGTAKSTDIISTEIGYDINQTHGSVVASRVYELDLGNGLKKRYEVKVPVFG